MVVKEETSRIAKAARRGKPSGRLWVLRVGRSAGCAAWRRKTRAAARARGGVGKGEVEGQKVGVEGQSSASFVCADVVKRFARVIRPRRAEEINHGEGTERRRRRRPGIAVSANAVHDATELPLALIAQAESDQLENPLKTIQMIESTSPRVAL